MGSLMIGERGWLEYWIGFSAVKVCPGGWMESRGIKGFTWNSLGTMVSKFTKYIQCDLHTKIFILRLFNIFYNIFFSS